ncbi:hypothetical protein Dsin_032851 [Dipteronia sinensis]|uniref:NAD(P)-binding domain-containing protein n=1 Tax=Dipteronia sinensis TaxID=43782 RepID=A0AAD9ZFL1_9ROSI|nr:hypothetical protein Dsin_032851 [Dipteronia sinensis]
MTRHCAIAASRSGRYLSTDSNKVDEPFNVEEAETVNVPPPPTISCFFWVKWFCWLAYLDRSFGSWCLYLALADLLCWWFRIQLLHVQDNGTANINAIRVAAEKGVKRFVYISAADFGVVNYVLQGYYEGKVLSSTTIILLLCDFARVLAGVILRPGFIYGTRTVGSMKVPLGIVGSPLEMVLQHAKSLNQLPFVGPLFTPPVNVTAVAKVAVRAATDPVFLRVS